MAKKKNLKEDFNKLHKGEKIISITDIVKDINSGKKQYFVKDAKNIVETAKKPKKTTKYLTAHGDTKKNNNIESVSFGQRKTRKHKTTKNGVHAHSGTGSARHSGSSSSHSNSSHLGGAHGHRNGTHSSTGHGYHSGSSSSHSNSSHLGGAHGHRNGTHSSTGHGYHSGSSSSHSNSSHLGGTHGHRAGGIFSHSHSGSWGSQANSASLESSFIVKNPRPINFFNKFFNMITFANVLVIFFTLLNGFILASYLNKFYMWNDSITASSTSIPGFTSISAIVLMASQGLIVCLFFSLLGMAIHAKVKTGNFPVPAVNLLITSILTVFSVWFLLTTIFSKITLDGKEIGNLFLTFDSNGSLSFTLPSKILLSVTIFIILLVSFPTASNYVDEFTNKTQNLIRFFIVLFLFYGITFWIGKVDIFLAFYTLSLCTVFLCLIWIHELYLLVSTNKK